MEDHVRTNRGVFLSLLLVLAVVAVAGCGGKKDAEAPQTITAPINNNDPAAKNAPSAHMDESPGALAARMNGQGAGKKFHQ